MIRLPLAKLAAAAAAAAMLPLAAASADERLHGARGHDHRAEGPRYDNPRHDPNAREWRHGRHSRPEIISTRDVSRLIWAQGWTEPHAIRFDSRSGFYTAFAYGWAGRPIRVTIDAYSGRIIDVERLHRRRHQHSGW